jgi:hypothetical protein
VPNTNTQTFCTRITVIDKGRFSCVTFMCDYRNIVVHISLLQYGYMFKHVSDRSSVIIGTIFGTYMQLVFNIII